MEGSELGEINRLSNVAVYNQEIEVTGVGRSSTHSDTSVNIGEAVSTNQLVIARLLTRSGSHVLLSLIKIIWVFVCCRRGCYSRQEGDAGFRRKLSPADHVKA